MMTATAISDEISFIKQEVEDATYGDETINTMCNEGLINKNTDIKNEFVKMELGCSFDKPEARIINEVSDDSENSKKSNIKLYTCHVCGFATKRLLQMQKHKNSHQNTNTTDASSNISKNKCQKYILLDIDKFNKSIESNSLFKKNLSEKVTIRCYRCGTCKKSFNTLSKLRRHLFTHMEKRFMCEVCNNRFSQSSSLRRHMQNVHKVSLQNQINYKCFDSDVDDKVLSMSNVKVLSKETPSIRVPPDAKTELKEGISCKICGRKCRNNNVLKNHMFVHTTKRPFECTICKKAYKVHATLRRHLATHMAKKFECDICKKRFIERSSLRRHIRTFHDPQTNDSSVHNCESCHKTFTTLARYERHAQLHGNPNTECRICSKVFHGLSQLKVHMRIHSGEKPFSCNICHISFTFKHVLITHQERIHQIFTRHKCNVCSILFHTKAELVVHTSTHVLTVPVDSSDSFRPIGVISESEVNKIEYYSSLLRNLKQNPKRCNECGESFVTRRHHMNHVIHHIVCEFQTLAKSKIPSYECRICKQSNFKDTIRFKRHLQQHVILPKFIFECESCGKKFYNSAKYSQHRDTHREYFQCDYCRKRFYKKYLLINHMVDHSERPFIKCIYCEKIFHNTANFLKHFEIYHEEKVSAEEFLNDEDDLIIVA